jgi:hypothetical protein
MASELPRITLRLEEHDEIELERVMSTLKVDQKSKLFLYMLHQWRPMMEKVKKLENELYKEEGKSEKLQDKTKEILHALGILSKYCKV